MYFSEYNWRQIAISPIYISSEICRMCVFFIWKQKYFSSGQKMGFFFIPIEYFRVNVMVFLFLVSGQDKIYFRHAKIYYRSLKLTLVTLFYSEKNSTIATLKNTIATLKFIFTTLFYSEKNFTITTLKFTIATLKLTLTTLFFWQNFYYHDAKISYRTLKFTLATLFRKVERSYTMATLKITIGTLKFTYATLFYSGNFFTIATLKFTISTLKFTIDTLKFTFDIPFRRVQKSAIFATLSRVYSWKNLNFRHCFFSNLKTPPFRKK